MLSNIYFGSEAFQIIRWRGVVLLSVSLFVSTGAYSAGQSEGQTKKKSFFDFLNPSHDYWSERLVSYAERFDRFFGDKRYFDEANVSVVQFDLNQVVKEGGSDDTTFTGRAKLALPLIEKQLHLVLENDPEKIATGEADDAGLVVPGNITAPDSVGATVRYQKAAENIWHYSIDAGVKLQSGLEPYTRVRGNVSIPMGKWRFKPEETLFWFKTIGAGETTRFDLEYIFNESVLFRSSSKATWLNDENRFTLRQDLSFYHTVDDRSAMVYQVSAIGTSQPQEQVDEYVALVRYRYRLHRNWFFVELSPQIHHPIEQNYHPEAQVVLLLEILFGGVAWIGEEPDIQGITD